MSTKALIAGSLQEKVLDEISHGVQASGIELQLYHAEGGLGQVKAQMIYEFLLRCSHL